MKYAHYKSFFKYTKYTYCRSFIKISLLLDIALGNSYMSKMINEHIENTCIRDLILNKSFLDYEVLISKACIKLAYSLIVLLIKSKKL